MIKLGLAGGRGYVGAELLNLLAGIPEYEVVYVGSKSLAGSKVNEHLADSELNLQFQDLSPDSIKDCDADAWIIAQDNGHSKSLIDFIGPDLKVIDVSSDHRFDSNWTYGLPERNESLIRKAIRIANPGCYATATQLALLPLLEEIAGVPSVFGISGYSGAGKRPNDKNDPQRLADNILPYSLTGHTHELEVSHHLGMPIRFMPHVAPFFRGISVTVDVELKHAANVDELKKRFAEFYSEHGLVEVANAIPEIQQVAGTNKAIVGGFSVDSRDSNCVAIVSVIDNLRKGAASQVVQNLNLMFGMQSAYGLAELLKTMK